MQIINLSALTIFASTAFAASCFGSQQQGISDFQDAYWDARAKMCGNSGCGYQQSCTTQGSKTIQGLIKLTVNVSLERKNTGDKKGFKDCWDGTENIIVQQVDIHTDNLLIAITDDSILTTVEENELHQPSARKFIGDTVIHVSQYMLGGAGALTICDLGQARIGRVHRSKAMPTPYRAPEVILGMTWGNSVDVWSVGLLAWDMLHQEGIFRVYDGSEQLNDAHHLAAMTALLGPPPDAFLRRSDKTKQYWDANGEDKHKFLDFLSGVLTWLPERRMTSFDAYFHPWLRGDVPLDDAGSS
ncbi:hypothetical protein FGRMN_3822 [Fusarium graminum]|nr:hypothetical protein FGRMN_3822 [Fusarium graminum]